MSQIKLINTWFVTLKFQNLEPLKLNLTSIYLYLFKNKLELLMHVQKWAISKKGLNSKPHSVYRVQQAICLHLKCRLGSQTLAVISITLFGRDHFVVRYFCDQRESVIDLTYGLGGSILYGLYIHLLYGLSEGQYHMAYI